jgi:hypothetical protein
MPDTLAAALGIPGVGWLAAAVLVAGLVRGFAGFGTALIYLPVAAQVLSPVWAIATMIVFDILGPASIAPRALRDAHPPDLARLFAGTAVGLPLGLAILFAVTPETFRYAVSVTALVMLACLASGLRYRGTLTPPLVYGTGGIAGITGGAAGIPGPPVILVYLASPLPAATARANVLLYLLGYDLMILAAFLGLGRLEAEPLWLGLLLTIPKAVGNTLGAALFRPGRETLYRRVAYAIIAASALGGLPLWNP